MRRAACALTACAMLVLSSCSSASNWSKADAFYAAVDGDSVVLLGIDIESAHPSPVRVAELGSVAEIAAATVSYGSEASHVLIARADGSREIRTIDVKGQQLSEAIAVPDYGTVARVPGGFVSTTPEVAGPVHVQLRSDGGKQLLDTGPLTIHPATMAGTTDGVVVVGSTSEEGTVMQRATRSGHLSSPSLVAADALPGEVAADGSAIAISLNRSIPKGTSPNAKATLPADNRLAIVTGSKIRFLQVGDSPNHVIPIGHGQFVIDSIVQGRRVIRLASSAGSVRTLARLEDASPVLGLTKIDNRILALQNSAIHVLDAPSQASTSSAPTLVQLSLDAHSGWAGP